MGSEMCIRDRPQWLHEHRRKALQHRLRFAQTIYGASEASAFVVSRWLDGAVILLRPFTVAEARLLWQVVDAERRHCNWVLTEGNIVDMDLLDRYARELRWCTRMRASVRKATHATMAELRSKHEQPCNAGTDAVRSL